MLCRSRAAVPGGGTFSTPYIPLRLLSHEHASVVQAVMSQGVRELDDDGQLAVLILVWRKAGLTEHCLMNSFFGTTGHRAS